jgi:type IV pilus assembly protein PilB
MEMRRRQPIGVELVKRGVVTSEDIEQALQYQREHQDMKLGDILYSLNVCDAQVLIENMGEILGTQGILLNGESIKIKPTEYLSIDVMRKNKCVPFDINAGKIKVCFSDGSRGSKADTVRLSLLNKGLIMEQYVTFEKDIDSILENLDNQNKTPSFTMPSLSSVVSGTIVELIDGIIKKGMDKRASDIHIEPLENEIRVRYRIDGQLLTETAIPKEKQQQVIGRLKAISNMHQEKQESQDGRILMYDDYNIRVSSQPNVYGEKFVLRLLKKDANIRNIFELGYPGTEKDFKKSFNKKNSITIIAAPTGEGKTTTLYSIIDKLNSPEINITTIEDPVEIRIDGLNQIEIDTKTSFSNSLRTVLRQDPDIILVGEIRDTETAEIAIQAGQTGHYVLSTIHTIDSVEVINRMRKMGVSNYDIASTLATSVSQRLVRKICPECRREREFTKEEKDIINKIAKKYNEDINLDGIKTYDSVGCKHCNNTGYYGRIGIFEVLDLTDEIKELIVKDASSIEVRNKALEQNYRPLIVDGIRKIIAGETTLEELNRKLIIY